MNSTVRFLSLLLLVLVSAQISLATEPAGVLARKAVSENPTTSAPAIDELRALGPAGLQALMAQYQNEIDAHIKNIRRKLEPEPRNPKYLLTVHGVGYKFAD